MNSISHETLTTIESFKSTIKNDNTVFRWFYYLTFETEASHTFKNQKEFLKAKTCRLFIKLCTVFCLLILFLYLWIPLGNSILLITIFPMTIIIFYYFSLKNLTYELSLILLNNNFPNDSFQKYTLYQIGETLAKKYNAISLVQKITHTDTILRKAIFYTFIFISFVIPQNFWNFWVSIFLVYFGTCFFINTSFFYKKMK